MQLQLLLSYLFLWWARSTHFNTFSVHFTDFKECLNTVYSAIEEADFLAIDGEFSGNKSQEF